MTCVTNAPKSYTKFQLTRSRGAWLVKITFSELVSNFNSHAHVERDLRNGKTWQKPRISTHTLTWSVTFTSSPSLRHSLFQLTRSRGAWLWVVTVCKLLFLFQLTRSRGAWPASSASSVSFISFQLTRSRGAWLCYIIIIFCHFFISTHTLTWSVTCIIDKTIRFIKFQLTRSRGAWPAHETFVQ